MKYRIEVRMYGLPVCALDTDDYRQARIFYQRHNELEDRWTQLYIDGETGSKAWMDREMHTGPEAMRNIIRAETAGRRKRGTNGEGKGK